MTEDEIVRLQVEFPESTVFIDAEIEDASIKWANSIIGKLFGKGLSY